MNKEMIEILEDFNSKMVKFVEDMKNEIEEEQELAEATQEVLKNQRIDQELKDFFSDHPGRESKKAEGGEWFVGLCGVVKVEPTIESDWMARNQYNGRLYETKEQAKQALIFQLWAMRFFRWVIEQNPEFKAEDLASFRWLLRNEKMRMNLQEAEMSGEVVF